MILTDIAAQFQTALSNGQGSARVSMGDKAEAFAWCGPTLNAAVSAVSGAVAQSRTFNAVRVENTTPVVAWTGPADKPVTATLASVPVTLAMFPGVCSVKTSEMLDTAGLTQALSTALYGQALKALDAALVGSLKTEGTNLDKAATVATIAEAQAEVMAAGGAANLIIVGPALYSTIVGTSQGILGSAADPREATLTLFGARLVVSTALGAAEAIVMDADAALAIEHESSPVALIDVHAVKNVTDVVIEVVGGHLVTRPASVISVYDKTP